MRNADTASRLSNSGMTRRIAIAAALALGCFFSIRASVENASATQTATSGFQRSWLSDSIQSESPAAAQKRLITQNIEDIRLGQRVVARNPLHEQTQPSSAIDPGTWRAVRLTMTLKGVVYDLSFLRPLSWIQAADAHVGGSIRLELHEMGLDGPAEVVAIDACPTIEPDDGTGRQVVTGTMLHLASNILDVSVSGLDEPLGVTDTHPVWSETRHDFIPAGQLEIGEHLRSETGVVAEITRITPHRGPPELTYNLEVDGEHVYQVEIAGILVHNSCMTPDQIALKELVEEASLGGRKALDANTANTILDWADEVNYPGWRASVNDLAPVNNHWRGGPHIHIPGMRSTHVPVLLGVTPR